MFRPFFSNVFSSVFKLIETATCDFYDVYPLHVETPTRKTWGLAPKYLEPTKTHTFVHSNAEMAIKYNGRPFLLRIVLSSVGKVDWKLKIRNTGCGDSERITSALEKPIVRFLMGRLIDKNRIYIPLDQGQRYMIKLTDNYKARFIGYTHIHLYSQIYLEIESPPVQDGVFSTSHSTISKQAVGKADLLKLFRTEIDGVLTKSFMKSGEVGPSYIPNYPETYYSEKTEITSLDDHLRSLPVVSRTNESEEPLPPVYKMASWTPRFRVNDVENFYTGALGKEMAKYSTVLFQHANAPKPSRSSFTGVSSPMTESLYANPTPSTSKGFSIQENDTVEREKPRHHFNVTFSMPLPDEFEYQAIALPSTSYCGPSTSYCTPSTSQMEPENSGSLQRTKSQKHSASFKRLVNKISECDNEGDKAKIITLLQEALEKLQLQRDMPEQNPLQDPCVYDEMPEQILNEVPNFDKDHFSIDGNSSQGFRNYLLERRHRDKRARKRQNKK